MGLILVVIILVCCLSSLACGLLADRKGYNIYVWTIAGGCLVSFVVLSFLPFVNANSESQSSKHEKNGNLLGAVLAVLSAIGFAGVIISIIG